MKRKDGTLVTNEVPMYYIMPHILTERHDSMNMTTVDIPIAPLRKYMNAKRREGIRISHMALILTAYVQLLGEYPSLNRFVVNRRIYQHNDIAVSLVVLRPGNTGNDDTMSKLYFTPQDTVFDVQRKIDEYIEKNTSGAEEDNNSLDRIMDKLVKMGGLMRLAVNVLKWMDKHNILPKSVIDASPFHASLLITNLASIRTNHIYHHVYDFGTTSMSIAMGNLREVPHRTPDGTIVLERSIPLGVVMDERIASGHYFALAFARMKEMLMHPELMETPGSMEARVAMPDKIS